MPDPETSALTADGLATPVSLSATPDLAPAAGVASETTAPAPAGKFDAVVDLWFAECIQGTVIGRYTDAYNAIYAAKDELKRRLHQET